MSGGDGSRSEIPPLPNTATYAREGRLQIAELLDTHESMINTVPGMENLKNNISTDLKMTLEAVHSV